MDHSSSIPTVFSIDKKNNPFFTFFEIVPLHIGAFVGLLFFSSLLLADEEEEKPISLTYKYTFSYQPKKKWSQEVKEYHLLQKHTIEREGNLSILHQEQQKLIWYVSKTQKRAEKSFEEQIQIYQKWYTRQEQQINVWKQKLQDPSLHPSEREKIQEQIRIATLSYQLKQIREEKILNQDCWLYEISWDNQTIGQVWIPKTLQWSNPVPFTLLEGPWDPIAQIKEKLPGPLVKLQMSLTPRNKYPLLNIELQSTLLEEIPAEKFDPN